MTEHYYSKKTGAVHDRHVIEATLRGKAFAFVTDAGVFSKKGLDYGSKLLINSMEILEDDNVLDVGCGYGPIGLSAAVLAKLGSVTMLDINERAIALAMENASRNRISNVDIKQSNLYEALADEQYNTILTNPPIRAGKDVVHGIFTGAVERLQPDGKLWVVIQNKQGAPSAFAKLESLFRHVDEICKDKGYRIFRAMK
jgi:16S rRNA (guanine1207-N2)-methyltransferase